MARQSKRKREEARFGGGLLADKAFACRWGVPGHLGSMSEETARQGVAARKAFLEMLSRATVVDATNVSELLFAENPKEEWEYREDFHCCALPRSPLFIESGRPSRINSEGEIRSATSLPERMGWLLTSATRDELVASVTSGETADRVMAESREAIESLMDRVDKDVVKAALARAREEGLTAAFHGLRGVEALCVTAVMNYMAAAASKSGECTLPDGLDSVVHGEFVFYLNGLLYHVGGMQLQLDAQGRLLGDRPMFTLFGASGASAEQIETYRESCGSYSFFALLALSFMHCKNVTLRAVDPDRKQNRDRVRCNRKPLFRHHVIDINPMRRVLKAEGGLETNGLKKAMHICRGHFARYTDDKPLFGHTTGLVWRPAHVRGDHKEGVVSSSYRIKTGGRAS